MKNENTTATLPAEQVEETSETSHKPKKKKVTRRVLLGGGLGTLAVAGVGAGWAYNRYLAEHTQIDDTVAYEKSQQAKNNNSSSDGASSPSELTNVKITSDGLSASEGSITITKSTEGSGNNAVVSFAAEIKLNAMTLLRGAFANNKFGQNIIDTPSNIAAQHNGIWAINGDYYGFRDTGIVIRNGVAYRDSGAREGLAFYQDGSVKLYDETGTNAQQLLNEGVWNTLSFGPAIVRDSEVISGIDQVEVDTNFGNHSIQGNQPRTGVGVLGQNHLVFIVVDGRSDGYSRGVTMPEFAYMFKELGCVSAYNLDGGGSSVMVFNNQLVNADGGSHRSRGHAHRGEDPDRADLDSSQFRGAASVGFPAGTASADYGAKRALTRACHAFFVT